MAKTIIAWVLVGVFAWLWRYVLMGPNIDYFTDTIAIWGWTIVTVALMRTAKS